MASCSIREELTAQYPTCMDYTTMSSPTIRAIQIRTHRHDLSNIIPISINEDEEGGMVHVLMNSYGKIDVYNYNGHRLFSYPNLNFNRIFYPRSMSICNNIVYVTNPFNNELHLFTTEGDLITLFKDSIQKGMKISLTYPSGVVSDENNNIYICTTNELVVMNSTLPVFQNHIIDKARLIDIRLFRKEIFVLCWEQHAVSINILSLACDLLRTIFLSGFENDIEPRYFYIDHYGNFVIPQRRLKFLYVYSKDGKMIVNQSLKLVVKPIGIKLLDNKRRIGISSCSFGLCLF